MSIAVAKSILSKKNIQKDDKGFDTYLSIRNMVGNKNGYVGFLTKLYFIDGVEDLDEIKSIFDIVSETKSVTINKLIKMSYKEVLDTFFNLNFNEENTDIVKVYNDNLYTYFKVNTYNGNLKIGSPAWCLKNKRFWDKYTKNNTQYVVVKNDYLSKIITPDNNYFSKYDNVDKKYIRYGITLNENDNDFKVFDDNNGRLFKHKWTKDSNSLIVFLNTLQLFRSNKPFLDVDNDNTNANTNGITTFTSTNNNLKGIFGVIEGDDVFILNGNDDTDDHYSLGYLRNGNIYFKNEYRKEHFEISRITEIYKKHINKLSNNKYFNYINDTMDMTNFNILADNDKWLIGYYNDKDKDIDIDTDIEVIAYNKDKNFKGKHLRYLGVSGTNPIYFTFNISKSKSKPKRKPKCVIFNNIDQKEGEEILKSKGIEIDINVINYISNQVNTIKEKKRTTILMNFFNNIFTNF